MSADLRIRKKVRPNRQMILSAVLFALIVIWLVVSAGNAGSAAEKSRAGSVRSALMNSVSLCYSIEGEYPPDIEYLEKNYGFKPDRDRYVIHYEYFGANVRPSVTVIDKNGSDERTVS